MRLIAKVNFRGSIAFFHSNKQWSTEDEELQKKLNNLYERYSSDYYVGDPLIERAIYAVDSLGGKLLWLAEPEPDMLGVHGESQPGKYLFIKTTEGFEVVASKIQSIIQVRFSFDPSSQTAYFHLHPVFLSLERNKFSNQSASKSADYYYVISIDMAHDSNQEAVEDLQASLAANLFHDIVYGFEYNFEWDAMLTDAQFSKLRLIENGLEV